LKANLVLDGTSPESALASDVGEIQVRQISIAAIDWTDQRFQYRLSVDISDLKQSLRRCGQQVPVILWGQSSRPKIIDGFRRITALRQLEVDYVHAIIRSDIDEDEAFTLSFIENAKRRNLLPFDKAHAIWFSIHRRGLEPARVAADFGLSLKQINRYLRLIELELPVAEALRAGRISMAHAVVLHRSSVPDPRPFLAAIESERLTAVELKRRVSRSRDRKRLFTKDANGFRLKAIRFRPSLQIAEKTSMLDVLERAAELIRNDLHSRDKCRMIDA
jgi:ParB/RepB/Spo0J family partition protein